MHVLGDLDGVFEVNDVLDPCAAVSPVFVEGLGADVVLGGEVFDDGVERDLLAVKLVHFFASF